MQTLNPQTSGTSPTNGARRTGATWVAATGAFLLLAAAAVFVATRWDSIPDSAKLAALVGMTGACALIGDRLRRSLPATGNALFHLGALLVPIDIAAIGLRTTLTWQELLLVDGVVSTIVLAACAYRARSVVLGAAASGAVIATACGVAAVTPLPAPLVLAAFAVAACFVDRLEKHAFVWAGVAALSPLAWLALDRAITGHGVALDLGVLAVAWPVSIATAAAASFVILRGTRRRGEPALALIAVVACVAHGVAAWHATTVPHIVDVLAAPSLFLVAEVLVLAVRRDPFWSRPAHRAGQVFEALATVPTLFAVPAMLVIARFGFQSTDFAAAAGIGSLAWIVADARRREWWWAGLPSAAALALFSITIATGSPLVLAGAALAIGLAAAIGLDRARFVPLAYGAAGFATLAGALDATIALPVAAGAAVVFAVAVMRSTGAAPERVTGCFLAIAALAAGEIAGARSVNPVIATLVFPIGCWLVALVADRVERDAADVMRATAFAVLPFLTYVTFGQAIPAALTLTALATLDGLRTRRTVLAYAAILPALVTEIAVAGTLHLSLAEGGLALCVAGSVWLGLAACLSRPWRDPLAAFAAASAIVGLWGAATVAALFGPALVIVGIMALALGLFQEHNVVAQCGGAVATIGIWITLGAHHVLVSEAYIAPVALQLVIAGAVLRRRPGAHRPSSWVAYGPAIALLAGSALAERGAGGSPWHSVLAGAVGVLAVAYGGWKRALAPLLLGTATLIAVVFREALDSGAGVPTWAWLAAGGTALIAAAVAMERTDVSPVEAGRRVVDVIGANFD